MSGDMMYLDIQAFLVSAKCPDTKNDEISKYPTIQRSWDIRVSEYPSIRIVNNLKYPTIHVSWILGYMDISNYPCIHASKYPLIPGYLWINYPLSKYPWYLLSMVSNYPCIHDIQLSMVSNNQLSMICKYPWYPSIRKSIRKKWYLLIPTYNSPLHSINIGNHLIRIGQKTFDKPL